MNECFGTLVAAVVLAFVLLWHYWYFARSNMLLERWASENAFIILTKQHRFLRRGPYLFRASDNQAVFRVEIQDSRGTIRTAWVRIGGLFSGLLSSEVSVRWDD